uniref:Uncharacterized mitochondrial protein AtMg00810-like n=1 Tax=Nicotiana tabacum TaxID=4097 RepID=A0A1S4AJN4_TOBAC|nr:PREDICTED: uncharacterized mitochondrial protein AtMg00810-like [Nicotiana tabacum]
MAYAFEDFLQLPNALFDPKCSSRYNPQTPVYVDDVLVTGDDRAKISALKSFLDSQFRIKDLGHLHYFLGLEILQESGGVIITQRKFALELLSEFACDIDASVSAPLPASIKLTSDFDDLLADPLLYQRLFCDSDWAACPDSPRSVSTFVVMLGSSLLSWKSKKEAIVSL